MFLWTFWYMICNFLNWNEQDTNLQRIHRFLEFYLAGKTFLTNSYSSHNVWLVGVESTSAATWVWPGQNVWPVQELTAGVLSTTATTIEGSRGQAKEWFRTRILSRTIWWRCPLEKVTGVAPVNLYCGGGRGMRRERATTTPMTKWDAQDMRNLTWVLPRCPLEGIMDGDEHELADSGDELRQGTSRFALPLASPSRFLLLEWSTWWCAPPRPHGGAWGALEWRELAGPELGFWFLQEISGKGRN
jgi:hypothetical protein